MPVQYEKKIKTLSSLDPRPRVAVESGTYLGSMTLRLAGVFEVVHTVELSEKLYDQRPVDLTKRVTWHLGDTRDVLPTLCAEIDEPVLWYLDAHFFSGKYASGKNELPLWDELEVLSARTYPDVIAVDDVHTFGKKRAREYGDWTLVSPEAIASVLKRVEHIKIESDLCIVRRGAA